MAENRASVRYAKALLELAIEKGVLEDVHNDMVFFANTVAENRNLELMLLSPVVPHFKKYTVLEEIFKSRVHLVSFSIFQIITKKNREEILFDVSKEFHRQYNLHKGIIKAQVTTTYPLEETQRQEFKRIVAEATGKIVELEEKVDPSLIGGFVIQVGDQQIDESIKHKLRRLQHTFTHA
jgi:F-type H+-transporting ATPase subunit delta